MPCAFRKKRLQITPKHKLIKHLNKIRARKITRASDRCLTSQRLLIKDQGHNRRVRELCFVWTRGRVALAQGTVQVPRSCTTAHAAEPGLAFKWVQVSWKHSLAFWAWAIISFALGQWRKVGCTGYGCLYDAKCPNSIPPEFVECPSYFCDARRLIVNLWIPHVLQS